MNSRERRQQRPWNVFGPQLTKNSLSNVTHYFSDATTTTTTPLDQKVIIPETKTVSLMTCKRLSYMKSDLIFHQRRSIWGRKCDGGFFSLNEIKQERFSPLIGRRYFHLYSKSFLAACSLMLINIRHNTTGKSRRRLNVVRRELFAVSKFNYRIFFSSSNSNTTTITTAWTRFPQKYSASQPTVVACRHRCNSWWQIFRLPKVINEVTTPINKHSGNYICAQSLFEKKIDALNGPI